MHSTMLATPNGHIHMLETDVPIVSVASERLPIVFVHGMACSANIWESQLTRTAESRRAIAIDQYLSAPGIQIQAILALSNHLPFSLHNLRPATTTITLPATGHWLMLDASEAFATALHTCVGSV